jgi:hypothetical protein
MFPANVYAAVEGLTLGGAPAMALVPRALMQLLFLAATLSVVGYHLRERRRVMKASGFTDNSRSDAPQAAAATLP